MGEVGGITLDEPKYITAEIVLTGESLSAIVMIIIVVSSLHSTKSYSNQPNWTFREDNLRTFRKVTDRALTAHGPA